MADVALYVVAAFFAAMGVVALLSPVRAMEPFGTVLTRPAGHTEVRAVYGGFGLAIAGVLVAATQSGDDLRRGIVLTVAVALGGMALGRILARAFGPAGGVYPTGLWLAVEVVLAGALVAAA